VSLPVRFSAEAAFEIDAAAAWYDQQQPGLGSTFVDAVAAAIAMLADWPQSGARDAW
jgi:hypothetical protein